MSACKCKYVQKTEQTSSIKGLLKTTKPVELVIEARESMEGHFSSVPCAMQVYYTIDKPQDGSTPKGWKGGVGYVTKEMASSHIPPPSDDHLILVCGPPPMYKALSGEKAKDKSQGTCRPLNGPAGIVVVVVVFFQAGKSSISTMLLQSLLF